MCISDNKSSYYDLFGHYSQASLKGLHRPIADKNWLLPIIQSPIQAMKNSKSQFGE